MSICQGTGQGALTQTRSVRPSPVCRSAIAPSAVSLGYAPRLPPDLLSQTAAGSGLVAAPLGRRYRNAPPFRRTRGGDDSPARLPTHALTAPALLGGSVSCIPLSWDLVGFGVALSDALPPPGFSILPKFTTGHTYFSRGLWVFPTFLRFAQTKHPVFVHIATPTRSGASARLLTVSPLRGIREHPLRRTRLRCERTLARGCIYTTPSAKCSPRRFFKFLEVDSKVREFVPFLWFSVTFWAK